MKGWAIGDGEKGTQIKKVQVSLDDGQTWQDAEITKSEENSKNEKIFSWSLWKFDLDLSEFRQNNV